MGDTTPPTPATNEPGRRRRNHRIPFLVAGAVAGLVVGVAAGLPIWQVPGEWPWAEDRPMNWPGVTWETFPEAAAGGLTDWSPSTRRPRTENLLLFLLVSAGSAVAGLIAFMMAREQMRS